MLPNEVGNHTHKCNVLKAQIENLLLTVKLAAIQPPLKREAPEFELEAEADA